MNKCLTLSQTPNQLSVSSHHKTLTPFERVAGQFNDSTGTTWSLAKNTTLSLKAQAADIVDNIGELL